ncbi:MAG: alanine racemase [Sporolactobacillus sp.]|nr:alanine racemase [Sporolactobacillus sp.]
MFLRQLEKLNPELINFTFVLHERGDILPDTYVVDLDMIQRNTKLLVQAAKQNDIELFYMTKQLGRNPIIAHAIENSGIPNAVVVDFREAEIFMDNGLHLGNVGHLVQPARKILKRILTYGTKYITMFSLENLDYLNRIAGELNLKQNVLLKVSDRRDNIYPGQVGGFTLDQLNSQLEKMKEMSHVNICGITTFPAILFDENEGDYRPTPNIDTINRAKRIFQMHNFTIREVNLPSATSVRSMSLIKKLGGTQGEPGHALSGTTPMHAYQEMPERPAYCYLSEVSHSYHSHSYVYGGGWYRRGHLKNALIKEKNLADHAHILPMNHSNIDYYLELDRQYEAGVPVLMAPRTQMFVTRSTVAVVKGLHSNERPKLVGLYDGLGKKLLKGEL